MTATTNEATVYLVDDDSGVRRALARVLREEGWAVEAFESAEAFLSRSHTASQACLVLDVTMPGLDGLALQQQLTAGGVSLPIVFVTGHGDIPMSVRAIKAGAVDFLTKPVEADTLVATVRTAIEQHHATHAARARNSELRQRLSRLTPREREVLAALTDGKLNKQIAADLGVVEQTVKFHRARIMERLGARTAAELMHIAVQLGIESSSSNDNDARSVPPPQGDRGH